MKKLLLILFLILCTIGLSYAKYDKSFSIYQIKRVSWTQDDSISNFHHIKLGLNTICINKNVVIVTLDIEPIINFVISGSKTLTGPEGEAYNLLTGTLTYKGVSYPFNAKSYTIDNDRYFIISIDGMTLGVEY